MKLDFGAEGAMSKKFANSAQKQKAQHAWGPKIKLNFGAEGAMSKKSANRAQRRKA